MIDYTKLTPKEIEEAFQSNLTEYRISQNKVFWDNMWLCVSHCCSNLIKSKAKNIIIPDFDGKVQDATIRVMTKIKEGTNPNKLSSFCYLYVIGVIYDRKLQRIERELSYEAWIEYQYKNEIC